MRNFLIERTWVSRMVAAGSSFFGGVCAVSWAALTGVSHVWLSHLERIAYFFWTHGGKTINIQHVV